MKIIGTNIDHFTEKHFKVNVFDGYKLNTLSIQIEDENDCEMLLRLISDGSLKDFILTHKPCFRLYPPQL